MSNSIRILLLLLLGWAGVSEAAISDLVTPAKANTEDAGDAEAKLRTSLESQITSMRDERDRILREADDLAAAIKNAPAMIDIMRKNNEKISSSSAPDKLDKLNLKQVADQMNALERQHRALDLSLNDIYEQIAKQQSVPAQAREKIAAIQGELDALDKRIQSLQSNTEGVNGLKRAAAEAERDRLVAQRKLIETELAGYQKLSDLYTASRDLLTSQLFALKESNRLLSERFDLLSKDEAARTQAAFAEIEQALAGMPKPVIDAAITNRNYNDQLIVLQGALRNASEQEKRLTDATQEIKQRYQVAQQQLEIGGYNRFHLEHVRYVNRILRPLLNEMGDESDLHATLLDARSKQFTYAERLRELRSRSERTAKTEKMLEKLTADERKRPAVATEYVKLLDLRESLFSELLQTNGNYVVALTNLELSLKDLRREERKFLEMLNQKLAWLHSSPPMGWDTLLVAPKGAYQFYAATPWRESFVSLDNYRRNMPFQMTLAVVVVLGLAYLGRRLRPRVKDVAPHIGKVGHDKFRYTLEVLVITLVLALPIPLVMALLGGAMMLESAYQSFAFTIGDLLVRLSPIALMMAMLPVMTGENGLARLHFGWSEQLLKKTRLQIPWLFLLVPLYALGIYVIDSAGDQRSVFVFGRVVLAFASLLLVWNCWQILRPGRGLPTKSENIAFFSVEWRDRYLWTPLIIGLPILSVGLIVTGYDYTAVLMTRMFYVTTLAGFAIFIAHQVLTRWFAVQERQIALDRALAKRAAEKAAREGDGTEAAGDGIVDVDMLDEINLESISERNRALLKVLAYSSFIAVLWQLWSDVAPALGVLDKYVLWHIKGVDDAGQIENVPITLWRVLCACIVMALTVIGGKNLPGLVEVVLLQRFQLEKGIRFAITTVARYCIYVVGIMVASELLGIAWEKVGWLVAALSVGLGFGLQEIFANFISGIIIVIERPIRIGDAVTIDGESGIVTQIRMRATTVTDWDQKELIIPNKTIVTNRLVNWTLSDSVTRVVFPVGVAYGTDNELVIRTLLEVAQQHPSVMKNPAPGAFFISFGDSTLNFELRAFVADFNKRMATIHDINMSIDRQFRARGIEIAFRQLEVRVRPIGNEASAEKPFEHGDG